MSSEPIWTQETVDKLNQYQQDGIMHPYTCGRNRTDENHLDGEGVLLATVYGWKCPYCDYTQDWVGICPVDEDWYKERKESLNK